ncbi:hypothetical protein HYV74_01510 [Candidatus Uhrbacteria bacterium]|nr:hypothetical protein [Candidatus Uhrbacteria bacterium]
MQISCFMIDFKDPTKIIRLPFGSVGERWATFHDDGPGAAQLSHIPDPAPAHAFIVAHFSLINSGETVTIDLMGPGHHLYGSALDHAAAAKPFTLLLNARTHAEFTFRVQNKHCTWILRWDGCELSSVPKHGNDFHMPH